MSSDGLIICQTCLRQDAHDVQVTTSELRRGTTTITSSSCLSGSSSSAPLAVEKKCSMSTLQNQRLQAIETGENKTSNKVVGGNLKGNTMKTTSQNYYDSIQDVRPLMTMLHATSLGTTSLGTTSLGRSINSGTAAIRTCT